MSNDHDVIVIGGGINGLTAASYLGKAGLDVLVLEARGQCGAHCETDEATLQGFMHNLHATWMITALSPAMQELELEKHGLDIVTTDYIYGKPFLNNKSALMGIDPRDTVQNWGKLSEKDLEFITTAAQILLERFDELLDWVHTFFFTPPSRQQVHDGLFFLDELIERMDITIEVEQVLRMNGFQALDVFLDSDYIKTTVASLAWIGAFPPIHRRIGALGCLGIAAMAGPIFPVHQLKNGSHALTHALFKSCEEHGVKILHNCPVGEIECDTNGVKSVGLSEESVFPGRRFSADKVISNLTLLPTFEMIGEDVVGGEMMARIRDFSYEEQVIFGVHYALDDAPRFRGSDFDDGIQKCFMGYLGGETIPEMKRFGVDLLSGRIPENENLMANWFVPTLADPGQAPEGCHTAFLWLDVPPYPTKWGNQSLNSNLMVWDEIEEKLADALTDQFERYAPGFKDLILDRFIYNPADVYRNNRTALSGNWVGGSLIPEQYGVNRPLPGIIEEGATRTFINDLYLSNSVHPYGATWLASGYLAAEEVAEDLGVRNQDWWSDQAGRWYVDNLDRIPRNLGVDL